MNSVRILIVDDHELVRRGLRFILSSRSDWQVCGEAIDGVDAVEKAKSLRPDVVLMDISMPRMSGLDATRIIRQELIDSKIILVSQNDPKVVKRQIAEVGASGFVAKGDLSDSLLATLEDVIRRGNGHLTTTALPPPTAVSGPVGAWLAGGGELGQLIRNHSWERTPLGPIDNWPQSLKTSVNLMLNSRHPMWIGWGPEITFLYNDAYIAVLSLAKHPSCLGQPARDVWPEIWDICGPLADAVFTKGQATFVDDVRLFMNRGDFLEETYYSFSYSPIHDEDGNVAGLFCPSTETTAKILSARGLRTLSELAANALTENSLQSACASSFASLSKNRDDIPFALLYLTDPGGHSAHLEQSTGLTADLASVSPQQLSLDSQPDAAFWPAQRVYESARWEVKHLEGLASVPLGPAKQRVSEAILLPVSAAAAERPIGVLVAGVSPSRKLDTEYLAFFELVAGQLATLIQNARASEEERRRLEALAEIDRAKTLFFSNVSHEFRTPLTLMLGPVEDLLAKSHTDLPPAAKSQLELVSRNGVRLLRLVNTLLDFSRIEAGRMQAIYLSTDLAKFTLELASVFRSALDKAGLQLKLDCPELSEQVFVDRGMWEKIVLNLLSNAFKFTFEGKISVSLRELDAAVELRVQDTGVGINPEELPRLFERFHRIENTRSRTHEGSGIGLALVQELVKLHCGSVRVESQPGVGSTFIIRIPKGIAHLPADRIGGTRTLATTAVGAAPYVEEALRWLPDSALQEQDERLPEAQEFLPVPYPANGSASGAKEKRPCIVVADDNGDMRQYVTRLLAERYDVISFSDGRAALQGIRDRVPDLILTDIMMPQLDGFGLLRELRAAESTRTIPVILLSARAGEEARVEGMQSGADDYLTKPFSAREMLARVQAHLELAQVRKKAAEEQRRRSEQFATLVNEAPFGVYLVDAEFRLRAINPPALPAFETIAEPLGRDFDEVLHLLYPRDLATELGLRFRHTLETGEPYVEHERIADRLDGREPSVYEWRISRIPLPESDWGVVCYFQDVTHQVRARQAIAQSEERLRLATEAAELGIWHWYPNATNAVWENDRVYEMFGRTREDGPLSLRDFSNRVLHPDDREAFQQTFANALEMGTRFFFQGRFYRKDGSLGWGEFTAQVERNADGSPKRLLGTALDITERKETEELTRRQRERFEIVAQAANVGFWFCDLPFDKLTWDDLVKEHFWLPPDAEVTIQKFYELLHPDDREPTRHAIDESIARNAPYDVEFRTVSPDGRQKWIRALGRTFYDSAGHPIRFDGVTTDITARKLTEERERKLNAETVAATAKFRAVFEQTSVFAGITTLDGTLIDANQLSLQFCGYKADDVLGKPFWETGWWRGSQETQRKVRDGVRMAASGIPYRESLIYSCADGSTRIVDFALHPIRDHEGRVLFLHPTGVDITDLKRAEENYRTLAETLDVEVRARTRELEARNRETMRQSEQLRELSYRLMSIQDDERRRIARELHDSAGQILTALGLNLGRIAQQAREQQTPQLSRAAEESQYLVRELSQEIRTTSYLLHPPLLDESGLAEALQWYIRGLQERSALNITLEIPENFGRLSHQLELAVFRIVQEALTNVHRHSGSKVATIRLTRSAELASLEVEDEGRGIPPEKLAEIQAQGVGIRGMRERVLQLGGNLKIDSQPGGTRILVTFPLQPQAGAGENADIEATEIRTRESV